MSEDELAQPGARERVRDRALARLDEDEIKTRMLGAFDRFVQMNFAVHLIAVRERGAIGYSIALYPDGVEQAIPATELQGVADEHRLDMVVSPLESGDGSWAIVLYPRW